MGAPDTGLFGPGSITWRIHSDPSSFVGGALALLVQALHPRVMAAVDQHSSYRQDPWGRFRRTSEYLGATIFGDTATAQRAAATVRLIHAEVRGIDPVTSRAYAADDPELLSWVHAVQVDSFLAAYRRYGADLSPAEADRYVAEMVGAAELVGLPGAEVPATLGDLRSYLDGVEGLQATAGSRNVLRVVLSPPVPLPLRPLAGVPGAAAIGLMPRRLRELYGLPWFPPADAVVRLATAYLVRGARIVLPGPPAAREAFNRLDPSPLAASAGR